LSFTTAQQLHIIKLCRQRYRRKLMQGKIPVTNAVLEEDDSPQQDLF
jgi:hypothetical protein